MRLVVCSSLLLGAAALAGCLKSTSFSCTEDTACGAGGVCEAEGVCSIADADCTSGRRFDSSAGTLAGQCTAGSNPTDSGVDMTIDDGMPDAMPDAPPDAPTGCNGDFNAITDGNTNHKYKLINTPTDWVAQQNTVCAQQSSYMAIPDDAAELQAIYDLAGQNDVWVGVNDRLVEGTFRDTKNNLYTALPVTGNKVPDDCVHTANGTVLDVVGCGDSKITVCECEE